MKLSEMNNDEMTFYCVCCIVVWQTVFVLTLLNIIPNIPFP